ncbi:DUF4026 domain-containing protein [Heyndrickxia sp. FSL K6-6286]|uniref:DUF4026 domain-containing protein n=1 Tax=Heyndrickxia sp. FSL K6-6286 TaxID=2921510 RepID=UPI000716FC45
MQVQTNAYRAAREGTLERSFSDLIAVVPDVLSIEVVKARLFEIYDEVSILNEDETSILVEIKSDDSVTPYEIHVQPTPEDVQYEQYYRQDQTTTEEAFKQAYTGSEIFVRTLFNGDVLSGFYYQLDFLWRIAPDMLFALDLSAASKVISRSYIQYHIENTILPDVQDLYVIHSIYEGGEEQEPSQFWFHTHGLSRAGLTDVELIIPNRLSSYYGIPDLFSTFVNNAIENGNVPINEPVLVGQSQSGYIQVIAVPWEEGLSYVGKQTLSFDLTDIETGEIRLQPMDAGYEFIGGMKDRDEIHQQPSCILFEYKEETGYMECFFKEYADNQELMYYKTNSETARISFNAKQSFGYFNQIFNIEKENENFRFLGKFGIPYSEEEQEHMWFDMQEIAEPTIKGILINQPYFIDDMQEGNLYDLNFDHLTDWVIYAGEDVINPTNLYQFLG